MTVRLFSTLTALLFLLSACVTTNNMPSDCSGARLHTDECSDLVRMASYAKQAKQAKQSAGKEQYRKAASLYEKAADIAVQFKPELYMEYVLNQAHYVREGSRENEVVHGLKESLAILQQAVPNLEKVRRATMRAHFYNQLGSTLEDLADVEDNIKWAKGAVDAFKAGISQFKEEDDPKLWADLHHSLGVGYSSLYYLDRDTVNLDLSKLSFLRASKAYSAEENLERWGMSVNAIADIDAMQAIEDLTNRKLVQKAMNGYGQVMKKLRGKGFKYTMATSHHNLGILLQEVGKFEDDQKYLNLSYQHFDKAMDYYAMEKDRMAWISAQSNQARSMYLIALANTEKKLFERAVELYRNAIDNLPQDKAPYRWAKLHRKMGYVYSAYGEKFKDLNGLEYAIGLYKKAREVYERGHYPKEIDRLNRLIDQSTISMLELKKQ